MRRFTSGLTALAVGAALWAGTAQAQEVRFDGTAQGCFGTNCTAKDSDVLKVKDYVWGIPVGTTDVLKYEGTDFGGTTSGGSLDVTLGSFTMLDEWTYDLNTPFSLFLNFANPTGITPDPAFGGNASVDTGWLFFFLFRYNDSRLVFEPAQRQFEFTGGDPNRPGNFVLTLNDLDLKDYGQGPSYLTGSITAETYSTPEPVSMTLLGTGLAGVAAVRRRRKQQAEE